MIKRFTLSSISIAIILFFWSGLTQLFPWGVPTTKKLRTASDVVEKNFQANDLKSYPEYYFTTSEFDAQMVNKVNTLTTNHTFSWIVSKPISYYNPLRYFIVAFLIHFIVGILITRLLLFVSDKRLVTQINFILLIALLASFSIYGAFSNWWGLTLVYSIGESLNLIIGWIISAYIASKYILKPKSV